MWIWCCWQAYAHWCIHVHMHTCILYCAEHILVSAFMISSRHGFYVKYALLFFCFFYPQVSLTLHINCTEQLTHWVCLTYAFLFPSNHYRIRICIWWEIRKCRQSWGGVCSTCKTRIQLCREGKQCIAVHCTEVYPAVFLLSLLFFSLLHHSSSLLPSFPLTLALFIFSIFHNPTLSSPFLPFLEIAILPT